MGNKLGIKGKEIGTEKFKDIFGKFADKNKKIDMENAIKFLEMLAKEADIAYSQTDVTELLKKIDPLNSGLDYQKFQIFFFESTEKAVEKGEMKLSQSMISSSLKIKGDNLNDENYSCFIQTDKPIYKPGEKIYYRIWVLHTLTKIPISNEYAEQYFLKNGPAKIDFLSPGGELVSSKNISYTGQNFVNLKDSIPLSKQQPGGNYKIKASFVYQDTVTVAERIVQVKVFNAPPKLNIQLEFVKKGLGPGDEAHATLDVKRSDLTIPKGATVSAKARIDGNDAFSGEFILDENGKADIKFHLPNQIEAGDGTLTCVVQDGGTTESSGQTIPIILQKMEINFFPEGGEVVCGIPNTIYFESKTPYGDSADFLGQIINEKGEAVSTIQTNHEGRGKTSFTPKENETYKVKIICPSGVTFQNPLPESQKKGVVISSVCDVYNSTNIDLVFASTNKGKYRVSLSKKYKVLCSEIYEVEDNEVKNISFDLSKFGSIAQGILRATVLTESSVPVAERLVYYEPNVEKPSISIAMSPNHTKYSVGQTLEMGVTFNSGDSSKEKNTKTFIFYGISIVDESLLEMVTRRKQVPRLPVLINFENEVDRLDDANIFLDRTHPNSNLAIDLLLGTQGWRKFAFSKSLTGIEKDILERLLGKTTHTKKQSIFETVQELQEKIKMQQERYYEKRSTNSRKFLSEKKEKRVNDSSDEFLDVKNKVNAPSKPTLMMKKKVLNEGKDKEKGKVKAETLEIEENVEDIKVEIEENIQEDLNEVEIDDISEGEENKDEVSLIVVKEEEKAEEEQLEIVQEKEVVEKKKMARQEISSSKKDKKMKEEVYSDKKLSKKSKPVLRSLSRRISKSKEQGQVEALEKILSDSKLVERVYFHKRDTLASNSDVRSDFTTTLLWVGGDKILAGGERGYTFGLNDSITSFRIYVEGVTKEGVPFCHTQLITSTKPFYVDTKLPYEVSGDDKPIIPVTIVNQSGKDMKDVLLKYYSNQDGLVFSDKNGEQFVSVQNEERKRINVPTSILNRDYEVLVSLSASQGETKDTMTQLTRIKAQGFPFELFASGELNNSTLKEIHGFSIPKNVCKGSVSTSIKLYLSPVSNLRDALSSMIRKPWGCFEQTSSAVYPMVMAQQYFLTHRDPPENLVKQAKENISEGYNRLKGFGVDKGASMLAFDWYGRPPGNESLTSYGLLEFNDMKSVFPVENQMLEKVKNWLLSRRNGKGGFNRSPGMYGFGSAPEEITNAYICWALSEQGATYKDLKLEVDTLIPLCKTTKSKDPYYVSLVTCVLFNMGLTEKAEEIAYQLTELQQEDGCVSGSNDAKLHDTRFTTITYSWGDSLLISSTGLAIYAWLKSPNKFSSFIKKSQKWLMSQCKGGSFGSTDSTILALKAIVGYDMVFERASKCVFSAFLNKKQIFSETLSEELLSTLKNGAPLSLPSFAEAVQDGGDFELEFSIQNKDTETEVSVPYSVEVNYSSLKPDDYPNIQLDIKTKLSSEKLQEGEGAELEVSISNLDKKSGQPMTLAIIGVPGGLEVRTEKLDEFKKSGKIDFYEMRGRELCIYFIAMDKAQTVDLRVDVTAKIPGDYYGAASRVYLYYTEEEKKWCKPLFVQIEPNN